MKEAIQRLEAAAKANDIDAGLEAFAEIFGTKMPHPMKGGAMVLPLITTLGPLAIEVFPKLLQFVTGFMQMAHQSGALSAGDVANMKAVTNRNNDIIQNLPDIQTPESTEVAAAQRRAGQTVQATPGTDTGANQVASATQPRPVAPAPQTGGTKSPPVSNRD